MIDGWIAWDRESSCTSNLDEELEHWQNRLHEVSTLQCNMMMKAMHCVLSEVRQLLFYDGLTDVDKFSQLIYILLILTKYTFCRSITASSGLHHLHHVFIQLQIWNDKHNVLYTIIFLLEPLLLQFIVCIFHFKLKKGCFKIKYSFHGLFPHNYLCFPFQTLKRMLQYTICIFHFTLKKGCFNIKYHFDSLCPHNYLCFPFQT